MKTGRYFLLLVFFTLESVNIFCQTPVNPFQDAVQLNNGYTFRCKILDFDKDGLFLLKQDSSRLYIQHSEIKIIKQTDKVEMLKAHTFDITSKRRWLGSLDIGLGSGGLSDKFLTTFMLSAGIKFRLANSSTRHYLNSNMSILNFNGIQEFRTLTWTIGYQYLLLDKKIAPFIFGDIGHSLGINAIENETQFPNLRTKGGRTWTAGVGFQCRNQQQGAYTLSLGYLFQPSQMEYGDATWKNSLTQQFKRIIIKMGIVF